MPNAGITRIVVMHIMGIVIAGTCMGPVDGSHITEHALTTRVIPTIIAIAIITVIRITMEAAAGMTTTTAVTVITIKRMMTGTRRVIKVTTTGKERN